MADDIKKLQQQIKSSAKTLNSRLRRLRAEGLSPSTQRRITDAKTMESPLVTESGYISGSYAGLTARQLRAKLKWIKGMLDNTETVKQAQENVAIRAREWHVTVEEAKERMKYGGVFGQVLNFNRGIFDSTQVNKAISEFEETPSYNELLDKMFVEYGESIQGFDPGRTELKEWMNKNKIIPWGVYAHFTKNGDIIYDDEPDPDADADAGADSTT